MTLNRSMEHSDCDYPADLQPSKVSLNCLNLAAIFDCDVRPSCTKIIEILNEVQNN